MAYEDQNCEVWQGDDFILEFDVEGVETDDDLSQALWGIYKNKDGKPLFTKSSADSTEIEIDVPNRKVRVILLSSDTAEMQTGNYYYELRVEDANGHISTIATGEIMVHPTILS